MVNFANVFEKYIRPPITTERDMNLWRSNPIQFWQNQVNFAVWCATAGCGVSIKFHFNHENKMVRSLYWFPIYFTIRRILSEMKCPLPQDLLWSAFNNNINITEYERICHKFDVDHKTPWCVDDGVSLALGRVYSVRVLLYAGGHDPNKDSFT